MRNIDHRFLIKFITNKFNFFIIAGMFYGFTPNSIREFFSCAILEILRSFKRYVNALVMSRALSYSMHFGIVLLDLPTA